jgi:hypothetical protein
LSVRCGRCLIQYFSYICYSIVQSLKCIREEWRKDERLLANLSCLEIICGKDGYISYTKVNMRDCALHFDDFVVSLSTFLTRCYSLSLLLSSPIYIKQTNCILHKNR